FGKSLGGGLAKISALLVDARRYQSDFGVFYGSTFGDDDLSALVALNALDAMDQSDVCGRAARLGVMLRARLLELREAWPEVIADVRGRGCMIGVELADQGTSPSGTIRFVGD